MSNNKTKEYSNGEITVVWKPNMCIHSEECTKRLPEVYHPDEKPWIKVENATTAALKKQIDNCPSGALSYYENGEIPKASNTKQTKIEVQENGPLLVYGNVELVDTEGNSTQKEKITALCRCGASGNKPYCDGSHAK